MKKLLLRGAQRASAAALLLYASMAPATTLVSFAGGVLTVSSDADDALVIACSAGSVQLNGAAVAGPVACGAVVRVDATGGPGSNRIDLASMTPADFTSLSGSVLVGGAGADTVLGSFANDTITWNPGDGSDTNDGGAGNDRVIVIGSDTANTFTAGTAGVAPGFDLRFVGPFTIDIVRAEVLEINGRGGDDTINASGLPAGLIAVEVIGGTGNDTIVGSAGDDTNIWNNGDNTDTFNGGAGNDLQIVNGAGAGDIFTILAAADAPIPNSVLFRRNNLVPFDVTMGNAERLRVNGAGGDDTINANGLPAGLIALEIIGGIGNDTINGSAGNDILRGGADSDTLTGFLGTDQVFGDAGDDLMVWNPGDGTDFNDGGEGQDSSRVVGAGAAETFTIAPLGCSMGGDLCARIRRVLPTAFDVDVVRVERLELQTGVGRDTVLTEHLQGMQQLLDGGNPALGPTGVDFFPVDELRVAGVSDARNSPVVRPGFGDIVHSGFEFAPIMALAVSNREAGHSAALSGAQEVPPVTTSAVGRASVVLSADGSRITVRLSFSGLSSANTMSHIHGPATPGANGPVIFDLGSSGNTSGALGPLQFTITPAQLAQLRNGQWYFNVHSTNHPGGEIRGQIRPDQVFEAVLTTQQVVGGAVASQALGSASAILAGTQDSVVISLSYSGLTGEGVPGVSTNVRLHGPALRGATGPALTVFPLRVSGTANDSFITQEYPITAAEAADLKAGRWYLEVRSTEFPEGELRGQLDNILHCSGFESVGC